MDISLSKTQVDTEYDLDNERSVAKVRIQTGTWDTMVLEIPFEIIRWLSHKIGVSENDG